ncbi:MAG: DNA primase [Bacillus thermozeamaize]|jgi:DNA primase|uniref:DNA primase n=1 Tax=Bacillus thermozeamaize TaxID=230954 RepID=A0A1Y3PJD6_9BACI|nr:MAG: DNA primase [Bacillus thermozeamaize]
MARMIPESLIEEVRNRFDIVEVVGRYVQLRKSGRNYFGLCPFHSEKTPSFSVSPEKQIFHCFGCGKGGNLFAFIQEIEGMTFVEAVRFLAQEAGVDMPQDEQDSRGESGEKAKLIEAYAWAARMYQYLLYHPHYGAAVRNYLRQRGVNEETARTFQLGYAPANWDVLARFLQKKGFSPEILVKGGLLSEAKGQKRYYDKFRDRLIIPIFDLRGRVIAFGGRLMREAANQPKYLNSPESSLFSKSRVLFHLHRARQAIREQDEVIIMEGYMDVMAAVQHGIQNVVATLGTTLTPEHARILRRHAEKVILCYDADRAGQEASLRGIDVLREAGCIVRVAEIPQGKDPDQYIRENGREAFLYNVLGNALPVVQYRLKQLRRRFDLSDEESRLRYVQAALEVITELPFAIERDHYLRELAAEFHLSLDALKMEQRRIYHRRKREAAKRDIWDKVDGAGNTSTKTGTKHLIASAKRVPAYYAAERKLLAWMMRDEQVVQFAQQEIGSQFNEEEHAVLAAYLYAYYERTREMDVSRFIHTLTDVRLVELASELAMMEMEGDASPQELIDYVKEIKSYPKWIEFEEKREEIQKAERLGDTKRALELAQQLIQLKKELSGQRPAVRHTTM